MSYRNDPRWQAAQDAYIADRPDLHPDDCYLVRLSAAARMYEIETEHAPKAQSA